VSVRRVEFRYECLRCWHVFWGPDFLWDHIWCRRCGSLAVRITDTRELKRDAK
jgi:DNA-directed RNA polymerase subunit RPC12/RpoP